MGDFRWWRKVDLPNIIGFVTFSLAASPDRTGGDLTDLDSENRPPPRLQNRCKTCSSSNLQISSNWL